jgi:hypothetical protein
MQQHAYAVTFIVQALKGIHQDAHSLAEEVAALQQQGGPEDHEVVAELKASVRSRAASLHQLLTETKKLAAKAGQKGPLS